MAFEYAAFSRVDRWEFAVEMSELHSKGATIADIRWLILCRFAEHAKETTVPGDAKRSFRPLVATSFPPETCLVLTPDGAQTLRIALKGHKRLSSATPSPERQDQGVAAEAARTTPEWDASRRELRYRGQVIKRYRVPAPNQELILAAFQEEGWPEFIDDPLPPVDEIDPKHRLQVTIKSLNRNQRTAVIRFHGNGNGLQVHWEPVRPC